MLPFLDAELIAANPKSFIGRSDNVYLNAFLLGRANMISFYGTTFIPQFGEPPSPMPEIVGSFVSVMMTSETVHYRPADSYCVHGIDWARTASQDRSPRKRTRKGRTAWLGEGRGSGPAVGGEIGIVADLLQSGLISLPGSVLFWDISSDKEGYAREHFLKVCETADLSCLEGMIIGDNPWIEFEEWVAMVDAMLKNAIGEVRFPVLIGGDCGHYDPTWVLPYGDTVVISQADGLIYPRKASGSAEETCSRA